MRILLVTVAGLSSRFSQSVGYPCLKCLYHEEKVPGLCCTVLLICGISTAIFLWAVIGMRN